MNLVDGIVALLNWILDICFNSQQEFSSFTHANLLVLLPPIIGSKFKLFLHSSIKETCFVSVLAAAFSINWREISLECLNYSLQIAWTETCDTKMWKPDLISTKNVKARSDFYQNLWATVLKAVIVSYLLGFILTKIS